MRTVTIEVIGKHSSYHKGQRFPFNVATEARRQIVKTLVERKVFKVVEGDVDGLSAPPPDPDPDGNGKGKKKKKDAPDAHKAVTEAENKGVITSKGSGLLG